MTNSVTRFFKEEDGATAIEYGLIAAVISIGIIAALGGVVSALNDKFDEIATAVDGA